MLFDSKSGSQHLGRATKCSCLFIRKMEGKLKFLIWHSLHSNGFSFLKLHRNYLALARMGGQLSLEYLEQKVFLKLRGQVSADSNLQLRKRKKPPQKPVISFLI